MEDKKVKLKARIDELITTVMDKAETDNNLDYFDLEIKIHEGNIDLRYTTKFKDKVK